MLPLNPNLLMALKFFVVVTAIVFWIDLIARLVKKK